MADDVALSQDELTRRSREIKDLMDENNAFRAPANDYSDTVAKSSREISDAIDTVLEEDREQQNIVERTYTTLNERKQEITVTRQVRVPGTGILSKDELETFTRSKELLGPVLIGLIFASDAREAKGILEQQNELIDKLPEVLGQAKALETNTRRSREAFGRAYEKCQSFKSIFDLFFETNDRTGSELERVLSPIVLTLSENPPLAILGTLLVLLLIAIAAILALLALLANAIARALQAIADMITENLETAFSLSLTVSGFDNECVDELIDAIGTIPLKEIFQRTTNISQVTDTSNETPQNQVEDEVRETSRGAVSIGEDDVNVDEEQAEDEVREISRGAVFIGENDVNVDE